MKHRQAATSQEERTQGPVGPQPPGVLSISTVCCAGQWVHAHAQGLAGGTVARWEKMPVSWEKGDAGTSRICQHPQRGQIRMNISGFGCPQTGHYRYDRHYICPFTQYGVQCGYKVSDNGLNATTAPKIQGTGSVERGAGGCPLPLPSPHEVTGPKIAFMPERTRPSPQAVCLEVRKGHERLDARRIPSSSTQGLD